MSLKKKDKPAGKKDRGSDRRHGSGPSSMQLPEPPNLEEELRSIWHKDVNDTPVYKDLPRLARRIVILGSLKPTESKDEDDKKKEDKKPKINAVKIGATLLEYTIYLNTSPITSASRSIKINFNRAGDWAKTYKICKFRVYFETTENKDVILKIFDQDEENGQETTLSIGSISCLASVEDSSRYFVLQSVKYDNEEEPRDVGMAFYTREESAEFKEIAEKHYQIPLYGVKKVSSPSKSPTVTRKSENGSAASQSSGIEEKVILETEIDELATETQKELSSMGSMRGRNSRQLDTLREKVGKRLSQMGTGNIIYKEEEDSGASSLSSSSASIKRRSPSPRPSARSEPPKPNIKVTSQSVDLGSTQPNANHHPQERRLTVNNVSELDEANSIRFAIYKVIMGVANQVETPAQAKKIQEGIEKLLDANFRGEMEIVLQNLFETVIGTDSKTCRVFKGIHQGIIHSCAYQLKARVTGTDIMTGDVRGPEGWQIVILFANDVVSVSHRRREKSIDLTGPKDKFWFEWVLHMTFDKDCKDLSAAVLKLVDLQINPNVPEDEREKITQRFCGGRLLIA